MLIGVRARMRAHASAPDRFGAGRMLEKIDHRTVDHAERMGRVVDAVAELLQIILLNDHGSSHRPPRCRPQAWGGDHARNTHRTITLQRWGRVNRAAETS